MKNIIIKWNQHFVVMATHPDHPNYNTNARGRKIHLATTHKRNAKTLCNMMVVGGVETQSYFADRDLCITCKDKAEQIIDNRFNKTTYTFTINTDASHFPYHGGITGWATWIKSDHYTMKQSGLLPEGVALNSAMAELLAIEQALLLLDNLIAEEPFLQQQKILVYFNCDSQFAIKSLSGHITGRAYQTIIKRVRGMAERYEIVPRHVKAHKKGRQEPREWVNNWCDQQAKALARGRWEELNAKATEKV